MKFIVSSNTLLKKLQILGGVINTSNTIPVLDHFLFDLDGSKLKITSSDLETTMISSMGVDSSSKGSRRLFNSLEPNKPIVSIAKYKARVITRINDKTLKRFFMENILLI